MLKIETSTHSLDLFPDMSISLSFENPLFLTDKIPVGHSLSFTIPTTINNSIALGFPQRINSSVDLSKKIPAFIYMGALCISSGNLIIEHGDQYEIEVQFIGAIFPDSIRKHLQHQSLGELSFGSAVESIGNNGKKIKSTREAQQTANAIFKARTTENKPEYVAGVMSIDGASFIPNDSYYYDSLSNQRQMFVNSYNYSPPYTDGYDYWSYRNHGGLSKIIPSYSVTKLLEKLIGTKAVKDSVFETDLAKLLLVCTWHPSYQIKDSAPVFSFNKTTSAVTISHADFMPDISANEFIAELLKLTSSSIYFKGAECYIVQNSDTIQAPCIIDWSDKLLDGYSISRERGSDYIIGFSDNEEDDDLTDKSFVEVETILDMVAHPRALPDNSINNPMPMPCYFVKTTNQYFEAIPNTLLSNTSFTHWDFKLLRQSVRGSKQIDDTESEREIFDVTINANVVKTNVVTAVDFDQGYKSLFDENGLSLLGYYYCPVVEIPEQRDSKLLLAVWAGLRGRMYGGKRLLNCHYPSLSHCNYALDGTKISDVNLAFSGPNNLLDKYHSLYRQWIMKDKRVITGSILLSASDLQLLDLRKKVNVCGVECFIKKIDVNLRINYIEPADIELVEC